MAYRIKHFSKEEQEAFKGKYDLAEPKEWAIMDGEVVCDFYDTEEKAQTELAKLKLDEAVHDLFNEWRAEAATKLGISEEEVEEIVRQGL